jgi:hypothetical protein
MEGNWLAIFAVEMIVLAMMWRVFEKRSNKPVDRFFYSAKSTALFGERWSNSLHF